MASSTWTLGLSNMKVLRDGMVTGIKFQEQGTLCCESCLMGGQTKQPFNKKGGTRVKEILELVHSDVCGPMSEKSVSGVMQLRRSYARMRRSKLGNQLNYQKARKQQTVSGCSKLRQRMVNTDTKLGQQLGV